MARRTSALAASAIGRAKINSGHAGGERGRALLPSGDRRRQHEPEDQAAAVAKKDGGRIEVVEQKAERRADQRRQQHRIRGVAAAYQDGPAGHSGNHRHPGSEPIDPVNQVERVGQPDDPEECDRVGKQPELERRPAKRQPLDEEP